MRNDRRPWERKKKQSHSERRRKESFCIFTEGKTEQLYFDDFNLPTLRVKCVGLGGGNAEHLLNEMLRYMNDETEDTASALNDTAESNPQSENETDGGNEPASEENSESGQE